MQEQTWYRNRKDTTQGGGRAKGKSLESGVGVGGVEGAKDKPPRFPMVSKSPQGPAFQISKWITWPEPNRHAH